MIKEHKCLYALCNNLTTNNKYCSRRCTQKDFKDKGISSFYNSITHSEVCKKGGVLGGINSQKVLKEKGVSMFYDKKIQSRAGKQRSRSIQQLGLGKFSILEIQFFPQN